LRLPNDGGETIGVVSHNADDVSVDVEY
jgi:hypothetical protein